MGIRNGFVSLSDLAELARRYGARISDRLNEMAKFVCVTGPNLRK